MGKIFSPKTPKVAPAPAAPPVIKSDPVADQAEIEAKAAQTATLEANKAIAAKRQSQRSLLSTGATAGESGSLSSALAYGKTSLGA